ncbi:hypothetical protein D1007_53267 [Hordeum vulgare]|nr:hypothetical protein D1007_53267 [Hordeum vulgare]
MASICVEPQILEEHLAVEATIDASRTDAATRLAVINDGSWSFLEGTTGAFDEDYEMFSQRACAYLSSRARMFVSGQDQATHHYEVTHNVEALPCSMFKEPIIIDISNH